MLKPKKKVRKKDLKEDRFVKATLQTKTFLEENYKQVVIAAIVILALFIVFILYHYVNSQKNREAIGLLGIAEIEFANQNYQQSINRLKTLNQDYGNTDAAIQGRFLLANIYFQQKKYDQAAVLFEEFIDSNSGNNILLSSAMAGLAACYEVNNNFDEAAALYQDAAKVADAYTEGDTYTYLAGICYKKSGKIEEAKKLFNQISNTSKNSKQVQDAKIQLILLGK